MARKTESERRRFKKRKTLYFEWLPLSQLVVKEPVCISRLDIYKPLKARKVYTPPRLVKW